MSPDELAVARHEMVERQLRRRGITSRAVLEAMQSVPREKFIPPELAGEAYSDRALYIGSGQTISQPYIVALMTEALDLHGVERVLEVGTGSGYQAAVLSRLAGEVVTIERHEELSRRAAQVLAELGCTNVRLIVGDGSRGAPQEAPFDRIIVTAAAEKVPAALLEQLAEGGVLVAPLGWSGDQMLQAVRKFGGRLQTIDLCPCRFVPLVEDQRGEPSGEAFGDMEGRSHPSTNSSRT
jgi:protein-L-isoaspartate(D-aspartate) O-methyltransferase